jgi:hypothetical protein
MPCDDARVTALTISDPGYRDQTNDHLLITSLGHAAFAPGLRDVKGLLVQALTEW